MEEGEKIEKSIAIIFVGIVKKNILLFSYFVLTTKLAKMITDARRSEKTWKLPN